MKNSKKAKVYELKSGDILKLLPEYGGGRVKVESIHYDVNNTQRVTGIITNKGIYHPDSFANVENIDEQF